MYIFIIYVFIYLNNFLYKYQQLLRVSKREIVKKLLKYI